MTDRSSPLFSFRLVPTIAAMLTTRGHDALALLQQCGLPSSALTGEILAPLVRIQAFVDAAASALGNPTFGLDLAEQVQPGVYGHTEMLMRTSATFGDGLATLARYSALVNPIGRFDLSVLGEEARLDYVVARSPDALGRHLNEYTLWFMVRSLRSVLDTMPLRRAWFSHSAPADPTLVQRRLGCEIRFGQACVGFAIEAAVLRERLRTADPVVHAFLEAQARALLSERGASDVVSHLTGVLAQRLGQSSVEIAFVAREMGLSPRTLQRRLLEAGTVYHHVLDAVRRRRADRYLAGGLDEAEIARRLGYQDIRSLRRAQERWRS